MNLCTGCRAVYYCSRGCQSRHWKEGGHNDDCKHIQGTLTGFNKEAATNSRITAIVGEHNPSPDTYKCQPYLHLLGSMLHPGTRPKSVHGLIMLLKMPAGRCTFPIIIPAIRQAVYECLSRIVSHLMSNTNDHKARYILFQLVPDLLVRLGQDQLAYDFMIFSAVQMEQVVIATMKREHFCAIQSMREHVGKCFPPQHLCYHPNDISCIAGSRNDRSIESEHLERVYRMMFGPIGSLVGVPLIHRDSLLVIKTRLWFHFRNLDAFYYFLCCLPRLSSLFHKTDSSVSAVYESMIANRDILSYIRSFVLDIQQCMPSSRFAVRDPTLIKVQIIQLLAAMNRASDEDFFKPALFGKLEDKNTFDVASCLNHDSMCHEQLKAWALEYCD